MWRIFGQASSLAVGLAGCVLAGGAAAQEYCVSCTEPNAVYRCVIDGAQPGGSQPLQVLCITAMAKQGGHATCGIKRGTVFDCDGPVKRVPWSALNAPLPPPPAPGKQSTAEPSAPAGPAADAKPDPQEPPKTVLEMAKRANEQTAAQLKQANENLKSQAKKTWECVLSLFTRCGVDN